MDSTERFAGACVIVTGAAGHLGSTILRQLSSAGCEVRGLLLPNEEPVVSDPSIRYYRGDVCDAASLRAVFENTDGRGLIVIHTAALISIAAKMPPRLYDVNVNGVKNVLRLCRETGVRRLVHVSSVHAIPELPGGQLMREVSRLSPEAVAGGYAKTKAEAAEAVLEAAADGLDAVVVFPSGILGPYDRGKNHLIQMTAEYMRGTLPACVKGGYDFVDVRDVADGCIRAAVSGRRGEGYILSGRYASVKELLAITGRCCGRKEVPVVPMPVARAAVPLIAAYSKLRHQRPLYTSYSLNTLATNANFSNEKARTELGYAVRPLEETVADMVTWLRKQPPAQR